MFDDLGVWGHVFLRIAVGLEGHPFAYVDVSRAYGRFQHVSTWSTAVPFLDVFLPAAHCCFRVKRTAGGIFPEAAFFSPSCLDSHRVHTAVG